MCGSCPYLPTHPLTRLLTHHPTSPPSSTTAGAHNQGRVAAGAQLGALPRARLWRREHVRARRGRLDKGHGSRLFQCTGASSTLAGGEAGRAWQCNRGEARGLAAALHPYRVPCPLLPFLNGVPPFSTIAAVPVTAVATRRRPPAPASCAPACCARSPPSTACCCHACLPADDTRPPPSARPAVVAVQLRDRRQQRQGGDQLPEAGGVPAGGARVPLQRWARHPGR